MIVHLLSVKRKCPAHWRNINVSEEYDDKSDDQLQLVVHHSQWHSGIQEVSLSIPL